MNTKVKVGLVVLAGAVVGFLLQSNGPIGRMLWPLADGMPEPTASQLPFLILVGVIEALAFGLGVAFLAFGYPFIKKAANGSTGYTWGVFLAAAWVLVNWVPHTSLHMGHGNIVVAADLTDLIWIEYGFHVTLIIAGVFLAHFVYRTMSRATSGGRTAAH